MNHTRARQARLACALTFLCLPATTPAQTTYAAPYQTQDPVVTIVPSQTIGVNRPQFDNTQQQRIFDNLVATYSLRGANGSSGHVVSLVNTLLGQIRATVDGPTAASKVQATVDNLINAGGCEPGPALLIHTAVWHVGPAGLGTGDTPRTFSLAHSEWHGFQWKKRYANLWGPCEFVASQRSDGSPSFLSATSVYFLAVNAFDSPLYGSRVSVDYKLSQLALLPANLGDLATALSAVTGIQLTAPSASTNQPSAPIALIDGSNGSSSVSPATIIVSLSQTVVPSAPTTARSVLPTSAAPYSISASFFLQFQPSPIVVTEGAKLAKPATVSPAGATGQQTPGGSQTDTSLYLPNYLEQLLGKATAIGLGPLPVGLNFQSDLEVALASYANPAIDSQTTDPSKEHLASLTAAVAAEKFEHYTLLAATEASQPVQTLQSLYQLPPASLIRKKQPSPQSASTPPAKQIKGNTTSSPVTQEKATQADAAEPAMPPALSPATCLASRDPNDPDVNFRQSPLNQYLCKLRSSAYLTAVTLKSPLKDAATSADQSAVRAQSDSAAAQQAAAASAVQVSQLTSQLQADQVALVKAQTAATAAQTALDEDTALDAALANSIQSAFHALPDPERPADPSLLNCSSPPPPPPSTPPPTDPEKPAATPQSSVSDACELIQKKKNLDAQLDTDKKAVDAATAALTAVQNKLPTDTASLQAATSANITAQNALSNAQQNAQAAATYSTTLQAINAPITDAETRSAQAEVLLDESEKRAQCVVTELRMIHRQTAPTSADLSACPNLQTVTTLLPRLKANLTDDKERSDAATLILNDIYNALTYTISHLREIDGDSELVYKDVTLAVAQEQSSAEAKAAPPPAPAANNTCCCCQNAPALAPAAAAAPAPPGAAPAPPAAKPAGGPAVPGAPAPTPQPPVVQAHTDPAPAGGTITGISFRQGDFPLLLVLHSPSTPFIPTARAIPHYGSPVDTRPLPARPAAQENSCVLPTEVGFQPGDNPCVQFIALTSTAGSAPSTSGGGQGGGNQAGGKNQASSPGGGNSTTSLAPSQPVDCSRQSSASSPCAFSRAFTVDEPEWWDISLGLSVPGVREKTYTISATATGATPTPPEIPYGKGPIPCPIGYTCANKHHADAMVFVEFYPFARAWEKGRRPLWTSESYVPHIAVGVPITSQSLYRPYFGLSEHASAWLEHHGLPLGFSLYGGIVWMKQLNCTQFCINNGTPPVVGPKNSPTTNLFYTRVWRPAFGIEISVSAITGKLKGAGGGGGGAGGGSKSSSGSGGGASAKQPPAS